MQRQPIAKWLASGPEDSSGDAGHSSAPYITDTPARRALFAFLQANTALLLNTIRLYCIRLGLAHTTEASAVALDVLQEVAVEALSHADRFRADGQPMAWLLGIAINVIKRRKVAQARQWKREAPLSRLAIRENGPDASDERMSLDHLAQAAQQAYHTGDEWVWSSMPERLVESAEGVRELLSPLAADDQLVVRLALLDGLSGEELAHQLGVSVGTARMRLSRALRRLRAAWASRPPTSQGEIPETPARKETPNEHRA